MAEDEIKAEQPVETDVSEQTKEDKNDKKNSHKEVEIPKEFEKLVSELDKMTALEVSKFVKFLEEHWGVSATVAAGTVAAPAANGETAAPAEEKSEFDVTLKDGGAQKVAVIKAVKDITGLGLGEAKAIVDGAPKVVMEKAKKVDAENAKKVLEEAGATVELT